MVIGKITIKISDQIIDRLRKGKEVGHDKSKPELYNAVAGIYASRIFGLCFYRNDELIKIINKTFEV
jgi:ABC-type microcin C transport system permease subunit YejB